MAGVNLGAHQGTSGQHRPQWTCPRAGPWCFGSTGTQHLADQRHLLRSCHLAHGPFLQKPGDGPIPHLTIWTDSERREKKKKGKVEGGEMKIEGF